MAEREVYQLVVSFDIHPNTNKVKFMIQHSLNYFSDINIDYQCASVKLQSNPDTVFGIFTVKPSSFDYAVNMLE